MTAAHLVFVEATDCGLRNLSWFLQLSHLCEFVAASYGAQQAVAEELESLLIRYGQEEHSQLAAHMPVREITLCEDETFHPQICLVAIEPVFGVCSSPSEGFRVVQHDVVQNRRH